MNISKILTVSKLFFFTLFVLAICILVLMSSQRVKVNAWTETDLPYKSGTVAGFYRDGDLDYPADSAIDSQGNIYIVEDDNHRVSKFNANGVFISKFGHYGEDDGELAWPMGIDVDTNGNVYVADGNGRIVVYNSAGNFVRNIGTYGSGDGQLRAPYDVVVDGDGNVYTLDWMLARVQKFNSAGVFQWKSGSSGAGNGQFSYPYSMDQMSNGNLVIMDTYNSRVQILNSSGVYQSKFGSQGAADGQFLHPRSIAVDSQDNIYVGDIYDESAPPDTNTRVQIFNPEGVFQSKFGSEGIGNGQFESIAGISINSSLGRIYVGDAIYNRIQVFNLAGVYQSQFGSDFWGDDKIKEISGVAVSPDGYIYVGDKAVSEGIAYVKKFNSDGEYVSTIGSQGTGDGTFVSPGGMDVDSNGNLYVTGGISTNEMPTMQKFNSSGSLVMTIESLQGPVNPFNGQGQFLGGMTDVAVDSSGNIIIVEAQGAQKFNAQGDFICQFAYDEFRDAPNKWIEGVSVAGNGDIYIGDPFEDEIDVYSSACAYKFSFGVSGSANGQLDAPSDVEVDANNKVYVVDSNNYRIQKFELDGTFILAYGEEGVGDGMFLNPVSLAIGSDNTVYVTDKDMVNVQQLFFDRVAPSGAIALADASDYISDPSVNVLISSQDNESGVAQMILSTSSNFAGASWEAYSTSKLFNLGTGEGTKYIYAKFRDNVGNESDVKGVSVVLDESAPVVSASVRVNSNGSKTANAVAVDSGAGVNKTYCSTSNMGYTAVSGNSCSKTFTASGSFWYYSCDSANHCSVHQEMKVTVSASTGNTTTPEKPEDDEKEEAPTYVTFIITDKTGQPIANTVVEIDGTTYQTDGQGKVNLSLEEGSRTITVKYADKIYRETVNVVLGETSSISLKEENIVSENEDNNSGNQPDKEENKDKTEENGYVWYFVLPLILLVIYLVYRSRRQAEV